MLILFDKGTPKQLRRQLFGHEDETAQERGWDALSNGELLDRAEGERIRSTGDYRSGYSVSTKYDKQAGGCGRPDEHSLAAHIEANGGRPSGAGWDSARRSEGSFHPDTR